MANSKYEYVKSFELSDQCLPNTWMVVRIDGKGFHKFTTEHKFNKPNDDRGLKLMNRCAEEILKQYSDVVFAFGESDEYSFVFRRSCNLYSRRSSKIVSQLVSLFSSNYVFCWSQFFGQEPLHYPPVFDGRLVCYPSIQNIRDYLSWRQADTHINNLYNTCFWALVLQGKRTTAQAEEDLRGTMAAAKNELLFSRFGINYNELSPMYKKGSMVFRAAQEHQVTNPKTNEQIMKTKYVITIAHEDIISDEFWKKNAHILEDEPR